MSRLTTHRCYHCGKSIAKGSLIVEQYDGFQQSCHRKCWRDAKEPPPAEPVDVPVIVDPIVEEVAEMVAEKPVKEKPIVNRLHVRARSNGWYDVYDSLGVKINPTPVRQIAAELFVHEANYGKVTE